MDNSFNEPEHKPDLPSSNKRASDNGDQFIYKRTRIKFPTCSQQTVNDGPLYPITGQENPFVLYNPSTEEAWDKVRNPEGIVPVVLNSELLHGRQVDQDLTAAQKEGLKFLWESYCKRNGCILAHDMGLGKTRTVIALILTLLEQSEKSKVKSTPGLKKCIVLAPKNAISVWETEITKWCPTTINVKSTVITPDNKKGGELVEEFIKKQSEQILILSYDSFKKYYNTRVEEVGFRSKSYSKNSIDLVICDEAHALKNVETQRYKCLHAFKETAKVWIGMTGTPYQNNLVEFCNLINFFRPETFDSTNYKEEYCKPITTYISKYTKLDDKNEELLSRLKTLILPSLQYRSNNLDVEKHEMLICAPLDGVLDSVEDDPDAIDPVMKIQHKMYKELTEKMSNMNKMSFYRKLEYLTKACIHPTYLYEALKREPHLFPSIIKLYEDHWTPEFLEKPEKYKRSGKIGLVLLMATYIKENFPDEKVVIVSASKEGTLRFIKEAFKAMQYGYLEYDGDTSEKYRHISEESFKTDKTKQFLFLSLKAGGTALTLTSANHMILMDPDWNPSIDKQALARIYRPGQKRNVFLYRLVASGTIEEVKSIKQLDKEEFEKYFKDDTSENVPRINPEEDMLKYYTETKSRIKDALDDFEIKDFNDMSFESGQFAEVLMKSKKYSAAYDVPECLPVLREVFKEYVSYAFHSSKRLIEDLNELVDEIVTN